MTDKKSVSSPMELYPPLNHPFKDVKLVPAESYEIDLPEHLWSAPDENGVQQKTIKYQAEGMSKEVRQRLHDEAHGTLSDEDLIEFVKLDVTARGWIYHESGMSPNPIDTPNLVHACDAILYAKLHERLRKLGFLMERGDDYPLEFTFRIARFMSHGVHYSRYVTNKDGQLLFATVKEDGMI